ncbi:hypothetical protein ACH4TC_18570 [Streptomyces spororaveus]|uniref:hypothetical protein n=1 Tax=Streptomyces spororaveus TaxID=284039 RepID=UPI00379B025E
MSRRRLFHPRPLHGEPVRVTVIEYRHDPVHGPCILAEVQPLDQDVPAASGPLLVTHGALVNQLCRYVGRTVVGRIEQAGGLMSLWVLSPLAEDEAA